MTTVSGRSLVLVEYPYKYCNRDDVEVTIQPNERYVLLEKTNENWWHVRKDKRSPPFYIPAKYVKELPADFPSPLDFLQPGGPPSPGPGAGEGPCEVTIRVHSPRRRHKKKTENRLSTFGVPLDVPDPVQKRGGARDLPRARDSPRSPRSRQRAATAPAETPPRSPADELPLPLLVSKVPSFSPADPVVRPTLAKPVETPTVRDLHPVETPSLRDLHPVETPSLRDLQPSEPADHPKPPAEFDDPPETDSDQSDDSEHIYESLSDFPGLRLPDSPVTETAPSHQPPAPAPPPHASQTGSSSPNTALSPNVPDLSKTGPRLALPPFPSPSPGGARHLSADSDEWEVHTDRDSGKEYYFHRASGQSTWDNPLSPFMEPESPQEGQPTPPPEPTPPPSAPAPAPALAPAPAPTPTPTTGGSGWEKHLDEATGRPYFYNQASGETSWAPQGAEPSPAGATGPPGLAKPPPQDVPPPLPDEDYPVDDEAESKPPPTYPKDYSFTKLKRSLIPRVSLDTKPLAGWTRSVDPDGKMVFTSEHSQEQWIKSVDDRGQTYYYLRDGSRSQWNLPELPAPGSSSPKVGNGVEPEGVPVLKNWRQTISPSPFSPTPFSPPKEELKFFPTHVRKISDYSSDAFSSGNSPELLHQPDRFRHQRTPSNQSSDSQQHVGSNASTGPEKSWAQTLEKAGILNKTKIAENGKRLRKNWAQSWTVLHGGVLTFHKDPKSAPTGNANKSNQIVPEFTVELRGANVHWASKDKSSKKHVLELKTRHGSDYLVQYDTESIISDWYKVIVETIRQLDLEHHSEEDEDDEDSDDKRRSSNRQSTTSSGHSSETDQGRVRTKLRKFLQRRPTLQSVKEKGYIRDNVFGCHLDILCYRENTNIPRFVEKCITSVEKRGLGVDGIYRVSGNLAVIQKLRHKADHEENLDLDDGQWEEIHVITGALKLFFRELPEPLFPFSSFDRFIAAIQVSDKRQKVSFIHDLVKGLPLPNLETMKALFSHLIKVVHHGDENRMSVQSVAIVFGPTLLRPETESANMTMHMIFQSQIVELILNEYQQLFGQD
ncbi:hypothetical protein COCON_G00210220 [Conger conger]|uniref:Rho GTPase activating protein 27 n=1 Tax=Conger conger TaxID=82655 RepID=A0A9Q1CZW0_CONCO|nr:hypothetical protein COCON_G00210220 [Conger conger]